MTQNNFSVNYIRWLLYGIFLISAVLLAISIFIIIYFISSPLPSFNSKEEYGFSIQEIRSSIFSSDGKSHSIAADFYITSSKKNLTQAELNSLRIAILEIIPTLDYEQLTKMGGTDYFTESIKKGLNARSSEEWIERVYVSNLLLDITVSPEKNKRNNTIEKMFQNY
ncbi:MAG: hypothetical protein PWP07_1132 [Epulopiscium sp.]|uniref:Flagellar protein FliL n=1 Tax=Defluviitalea raffinosedens TaxID=1450156 RepID=A0A7C8LD17_9FIRM|nr:hypothetical protein [Defluviitalea raffinosedens]KAE9635405.1 hypothetical protein GND95_04460 [Defluviitalea raffinosedens]MBM7684308.1 flagellar basal body-associated protein FliL [Defluviitalea raffinosedens]MDK2787907.1 hypothetical protein [Candidatus Epulonipiscium sp.]